MDEMKKRLGYIERLVRTREIFWLEFENEIGEQYGLEDSSEHELRSLSIQFENESDNQD